MPELPEVETIRRQLEHEIVGRRIESLEVLDPRWTEPVPVRRVEEACAGRLIEAVGRRGKYLLLGLEGGRSLVMHLRMTGNLVLADGPGEARFLRVTIQLDDGRRLLFTDARRFGTGVVLEDAELEDYLGPRAGIEPLSEALTAEALGELAAARRAPLKSFLMVQAGIAGIGNIYADEALHRAGLHPMSPAGSMRPEHWEALRAASRGRCRTSSWSMRARGCRARAAVRRSGASSSPGARRTSAPAARRGCAAGVSAR